MAWKQRGRNFFDTLKCYARALFLRQRMRGGLDLDERPLPAVAEMNICLQSKRPRVN